MNDKSNSMEFCMNTNETVFPQSLRALIQSPSLEKRREAFDQYLKANDDLKIQYIWTFLDAPYRDIREAVIDSCTSEQLNTSSWKSAIVSKISEPHERLSVNVRQALLIFIQRLEGELDPQIVQFYTEALDDPDADVQYQAFVLAELHEEKSPAYIDRLKQWIDSNDPDFRIVAIQALARLNPDWAFKTLEQKLNQSVGEEAFQILLTMIRICPDQERMPALAHQLIKYAIDDRFAFPAIQAIAEHGTKDEIPDLLSIAKSILGEPTIRVAAAGAAAKLGSEDGRALLVKFSNSRHGNPKYAAELLEELKDPQQPAN